VMSMRSAQPAMKMDRGRVSNNLFMWEIRILFIHLERLALMV